MLAQSPIYRSFRLQRLFYKLLAYYLYISGTEAKFKLRSSRPYSIFYRQYWRKGRIYRCNAEHRCSVPLFVSRIKYWESIIYLAAIFYCSILGTYRFTRDLDLQICKHYRNCYFHFLGNSAI